MTMPSSLSVRAACTRFPTSSRTRAANEGLTGGQGSALHGAEKHEQGLVFPTFYVEVEKERKAKPAVQKKRPSCQNSKEAVR
mmetsp:Transcript_11078/g.26275  ORF Transcript_11078/g.26275 Transcript_11078/m.26275 type:complete len:82 (-) Transcript_11078:1596-1841(-)